MNPIFHVVHELGCRTHIDAMVANKIRPTCCKCDPQEDCLFETISSVEENEAKRDREALKAIKYPELEAEMDSHGNLYRKEK